MAIEPAVYRFREWQFDSTQRLLFRNGQLVPAQPKVLEILCALLESHGHLVEKERLISRVWPDTFVDEGSLLRNVSTLRKLLGDGEEGVKHIETIPKRGYRFIADVEVAGGTEKPLPGGPVVDPIAEVPPLAGTTASRPRVVIAVVTIAALAVLAWTAWPRFGRAPLPFAQREWLLIADFANHTGDARFDRGLQVAFSIGLEQSQYVNVVPRSRVAAALQRMGRPPDARLDEATATEICQREGLRAVVATDLTRAGRQYALVARLIDPKSGIAVRAYTQRTDGEDGLLDALDAIARELRADLGESLTAVSEAGQPLPQVTTTSLAALQLFAEGRELWNRGKYAESLAAHEGAVRSDPDFAMAHAALGSAYESQFRSNPEKSREHFERALQLATRTTARERLLIDIRYQATLRHAEEAMRLSDRYLALYPDDVDARRELAYQLLLTRRCDEAVGHYREILRIVPGDAGAHINTGTCLIFLARFADAVAAYRRAFDLEPPLLRNELYNRQYGFALIQTGQIDQARDTYAINLNASDALVKGHALRSLAFVDVYQGRYQSAIAGFRQALPLFQHINHARTKLFVAQLTLLSDRREGLRQLEQAERVLPRPRRLVAYSLYCRMGVEYVRAGDLGSALRVLDECRADVDPKSPTAASDLHRLEGEVELARANAARALEILRQADQESRTPLTVDSLARAFHAAGRTDDAIRTYELLIAMPDVLGWEAQLPWTEAHIALAQLHARHGDHAKARHLLDALMARWHSADSDLHLLAVARQLRAKVQTPS